MENIKDYGKVNLINELTQGKELVNQLRFHISPHSPTGEILIENILSTFNNALSKLNCNGYNSEPRVARLNSPMTESPQSGSPRSDDSDTKDQYKRRKSMHRWTEQVRVTLGSGIEGPQEDGHSWRKYGQKDILGAKYPRSYYRCTQQKLQGCKATKQVQRSDEDPLLFDITYRGNHTCNPIGSPAQSSKAKQEQNQDNLLEQQRKRKNSKDWMQNFQVGLRVKTENQQTQEPTPIAFAFPSVSLDNNYINSLCSYLSPTTPESNYFSPCPMTNVGSSSNFRNSENELNEIISATTSASNSSVFDLDFALDSFDLDSNFPFNDPNFLN